MISAEKALRIILEAVPRTRKEKVRLENASGRTAAEDIIAREDIPPFANSSMDGYAVRSVDLQSASARNPIPLVLAGESSAGNPFSARLKPRTAVRIMTGGKLPGAADAVVPVERVSTGGDRAVIFTAPAPRGDFVRRTGEDISRGTRVIKSGELLGPSHIGVIASTGHSALQVAVRPLTGILATGDELVAPDRLPGPGQIRNSSSYALFGMVKEAGAKPDFLGIARDSKKTIRKKVREGLGNDILLLTGGVSVGARDYVREVLEQCSVRILFWRVNIRPGSPLLFGVYRGTLVFGLPGNPVSTAVTFLEFVRPAIRKMLGRKLIFPNQFTALTEERLEARDGKRLYLRGIARQAGGVLHVRTTGSQSSGVMSSMLRANCLIMLPGDRGSVPAGSEVAIEFFRDPLST